MKNRKKAMDVFNETNHVFLGKTIFTKAFPEIEDFKIEIDEIGYGSMVGKRFYTSVNKPDEFINCSNPMCYNGGFSIGNILRDMVSKKQTNGEFDRGCQGNEGSPKGRKIYKSCINYFKIKVEIKYKK